MVCGLSSSHDTVDGSYGFIGLVGPHCCVPLSCQLLKSPHPRRCARHLSELQVEPNVVAPFDIRLEVGDGNGTGRPTDAAECLAEHWTVHVDAGHGVGRVSVRNDRLVTVVFGTGD
eukprot:scaffold20560_cov34-Tisochrysis_lutea.AAC.4